MPKTAIVVLACREFEMLELTLACVLELTDPQVPVFVLLNCRGGYDAERTAEAARRYAALYPGRMEVVADLEPGPAYRSLHALIDSRGLERFQFLCKIDDDCFPLASGWLEQLEQTYLAVEPAAGGELAYATPMINNNCWGFPEVLRALDLEDEYFGRIARPHLAGFVHSTSNPPHLVAANLIDTGQNGTIWSSPHAARWLHQRTTLDPDRFIAATAGAGWCAVPTGDRYSIGCILLRPHLWHRIDDGGTDDEHMLQSYCLANGSRIVCARSVPFVHLAYFNQREEIRDLLQPIRSLYQKRLVLPFRLGLYETPHLEILARMRWLETELARLRADCIQVPARAPVAPNEAPAQRLTEDRQPANRPGDRIARTLLHRLAFWRRR